MIGLMQSEFKKYKGTYVYALGLLGMISPIILVAVGTFIVKGDLINNGLYNWHSFTGRAIELFVFFVGPLITSFIAVSSIFYEYQSHAIGNLLTTPYSRWKIITGKLTYISLLILVLYACVTLTNIACAVIMGFQITTTEIINYSSYFMLAGVSTLVIVPLAMLLTLIFRSFIPAMIISVAGIIPNLAAFHWDKCYISPWAAPEILVLKIGGFLQVNLVNTVIFLIFYAVLFLAALLVYFNYSDQY